MFLETFQNFRKAVSVILLSSYLCHRTDHKRLLFTLVVVTLLHRFKFYSCCFRDFTTQKRSFQLKIFSVNMTKSAVTADWVQFTGEIVRGKLHFLCSACDFENHWKRLWVEIRFNAFHRSTIIQKHFISIITNECSLVASTTPR